MPAAPFGIGNRSRRDVPNGVAGHVRDFDAGVNQRKMAQVMFLFHAGHQIFEQNPRLIVVIVRRGVGISVFVGIDGQPYIGTVNGNCARAVFAKSSFSRNYSSFYGAGAIQSSVPAAR